MATSILKILVLGKILAVVWLQATIYVYRQRKYCELKHFPASQDVWIWAGFLQAYLGDDYPRIWTISGAQEQVAIPFENSVHFAFNTVISDAEWDSLVPGRGLIQLGEDNQTFSISMFHQLRCISLLRSDITQRRSSNYTTTINPLTGHCLNYLRQMALCRADIDLEPVLLMPHLETQPGKYRCTNWNSIYEAVLENQRAYPVWWEWNNRHIFR